MLSRLNWDLQLGLLRRSGWIEPFSNTWSASSFGRSIEDIALAARGMVESTLAKDRIADHLLDEWGAFRRGLNEAAEAGALRRFDLCDANFSLIAVRQEPWDLRQVHDDLCKDLVFSGVDLIDRLLKTLEAGIGEHEIRALHLGKLVDHAVHTRDAYRLTYEEPADLDDPIIDLDEPSRGSWWLATRTPIPGEDSPGWEWFRRVAKRWEELGLDEPLPDEFLRLASDEPDQDAIGDLVGLIASVDRAAMAGLARLNRREPSSSDLRTPDSHAEGGTTIEAGYLGLLLDDEKRIAGRKGYDHSVELASKTLLWTILAKLVKYGKNLCTKNDIKICWIEASKDDTPNDGAVYQAVSELRSQLEEQLGLTIKNDRSEGYRINEFSCKLPRIID